MEYQEKPMAKLAERQTFVFPHHAWRRHGWETIEKSLAVTWLSFANTTGDDIFYTGDCTGGFNRFFRVEATINRCYGDDADEVVLREKQNSIAKDLLFKLTASIETPIADFFKSVDTCGMGGREVIVTYRNGMKQREIPYEWLTPVAVSEEEPENDTDSRYKELKRAELIAMIESLKAQMAEQQREIENTKYATKIELEHLALEQEKMGKLCYEMLKNVSNGVMCVSTNFETRMKTYAKQHYNERNRLKTESVLIETSLQPSEEETDSQPEQ